MAEVLQSVNSSDLLFLDAANLLDRLDSHLEALHPISEGGRIGKVRSLEDVGGGRRDVGTTNYESGVHEPGDLDVHATYANDRALADQTRDSRRPSNLHVLVEYGHRYQGSTGEYSLGALARLTVASTILAAERDQIKAQAVFVADGVKPLVLESGMDTSDSVWALSQYDQFRGRADDTKGRPRSAADSANALRKGLDTLTADENFDPDNDVCFVASDFLMGADRNSDGIVTGFNWHPTLANLADEMGDRLYVARFTTPAQKQLPASYDLEIAGPGMHFDTDEYIAMYARYARAAQKGDKVTEILKGMRLLELSSTSETPDTLLGDFIFGEPVA